MGSVPSSEKSPEEGNGNPPRYSCLENPMDREELRGPHSMWSQTVGHNLVTEEQQQFRIVLFIWCFQQ